MEGITLTGCEDKKVKLGGPATVAIGCQRICRRGGSVDRPDHRVKCRSLRKPLLRREVAVEQHLQLAAIQLVLGAPNESGTRLTVNLETPSNNTFVYEFMS